jgi:glycosyltransferase involved in cell wall biosynthesis
VAAGTDTTRVSVVIPALNEAERLPVLLDHLRAQTRPPDEIIVADADSLDSTAEIARAAGCRAVRGGLPGVGRNAGAAVATGDLIMFMDADAQPAPGFLSAALEEFRARGLTVATVPMRPVEPNSEYVFMCAAAEAYTRALQKISPHAVGLCTIVTRELHERIGGFDESVVLAEDHEYARRAARAGTFGILRSVTVPASMRRLRKEGRMHLARVMFYSEMRTLAGIPIRSTPFPYEFGDYCADDEMHRNRLMRQLAKPSSEVQTDALGVQVASAVGGGLGTAALVAAGAGPETYLAFAGAAAAVAGLSTYEFVRKLRFEKTYGEFFMASVAVASDDLRAADGRVFVHRGVDEVCELHVITHLGRMARLTRQGLAGRLTIMLEAFEGLRALMDDLDDPRYRDVTHFTARSDLSAILFKAGFDEVVDPPRFDAFNRVHKRALMWFIGRRIGRHRPGDADAYRMAVASRRRLASAAMRGAVDAQVARVRRDLERASRTRLAG